jgi:hypothetical protein
MFRMDENRARFVDAMTKLVAVVAVAVGGGWTLYTYLNAREDAARTALIEARKPFEVKRLELYLELSSVTAILVESKDKSELKKASERLANLYWGPMALVADKNVQQAMTNFGRCLDLPDSGCIHDSLPELAGKLNQASRDCLAAGWDVYLPESVVTFERLENLRQ